MRKQSKAFLKRYFEVEIQRDPQKQLLKIFASGNSMQSNTFQPLKLREHICAQKQLTNN